MAICREEGIKALFLVYPVCLRDFSDLGGIYCVISVWVELIQLSLSKQSKYDTAKQIKTV